MKRKIFWLCALRESVKCCVILAGLFIICLPADKALPKRWIRIHFQLKRIEAGGKSLPPASFASQIVSKII